MNFSLPSFSTAIDAAARMVLAFTAKSAMIMQMPTPSREIALFHAAEASLLGLSSI